MLKNIQALRAFAALLVVFDHMNGVIEKTDPGARTFFEVFRYFGNFGVDLFFVISGFIMMSTSWSAFGRTGVSRTFLLRRIVRIYPPYWLILLPIVVTYFVGAHQLMHSHEGKTDILASILLLPQTNDPLLIVSWTLTFEMFFYVIFAALLKAKRNLLLPILTMWFVLELCALSVWHGDANPYLAFLGTPLPIEFIFGAIIGVAFRKDSMPGALVTGIIGPILALAVWVASSTPGLTADLTKNDLARVLEFGLPAALIVYGAVGCEMRFASMAPKWMVRLGDSSYAMYLWHVPIMIVIGRLATRLHVHGLVADQLIQLTCLFVVVGISLAVFQYFEKPITSFLNRRLEMQFLPAVAAGPGIVGYDI
jgi:exopolysaccharide production protein ExoZ